MLMLALTHWDMKSTVKKLLFLVTNNMWIALLLMFCKSASYVTGADEDCNDGLILPGNGNLTSSSTRNPSASFGPQQALLHNTHAWCANSATADQYLTVDFGLVKMIKSIAIQGNPNDDEFIKTFSISYGVLEGQWITYTETGAKRAFKGNSDSGTVSKQLLKKIIAARYVRINPENWYDHVCARLQVFGCNADPHRALGMASGDIPNHTITASSAFPALPSFHGRLHWTKYGDGNYYQAWAAGQPNTNQWLQIDLSLLRFVAAIATQGRHVATQWVKSYWFSYGNDGTTFNEYKDQNQARKTFQGNTDTDTVVRHRLSPVIFARFVRFNPMTWYAYICMRVEVYSFGRTSPADLGMETKEIPDSQISVSSQLNAEHAYYMGRINYPLGVVCAWCPLTLDTNQWFQIDMGHTMLVTGVVTQSRGNGYQHWVTGYKVLYSLNSSVWEYYKDNPKESEVKTFAGNSNNIEYVTNTFNRDIKARFIRINPTGWQGYLCMRVAVLGRRNGPLGSPVSRNQASSSYITVNKNHDVTLKCEAVGDTPITFTWTHKGQVLQSKTNETHLTLIGVTKAQEGFYNCSATNTLGTNTRIVYLNVKESFNICSKYQSLSDGSRLVTSTTSYINDDSKLNATDWYVFKDNHNYFRIPTTCVPENRCGATASGHMQGALPTVNEGIVKRKVCFHSNGNCCHYSVDIYVRNCYMFYVYNLKKLDLSWKGRYCVEAYENENPSIMFQSSAQSLALNHQVVHRVYEVDSYFVCMTYCNLADECRSFNYNHVLMICELSNSTASLFPQYLSAKEHYQYFGLIV